MAESYRTIAGNCGPAELREKGSKFLAFAFPVHDLHAAETALLQLKSSYHDASHVPYALRLGEGEERTFKYSDDGEPNGTGGIPIYQEIGRRELFNVLVAVVRYFGGTKLGKGNLQRAFAAAARLALDNAAVREIRRCRTVKLAIPFDFTGELMQMINRMAISIVTQHYLATGVSFTLDIPETELKAFHEALSEKSGGSIKVTAL